jgi:hypothetical protein
MRSLLLLSTLANNGLQEERGHCDHIQAGDSGRVSMSSAMRVQIAEPCMRQYRQTNTRRPEGKRHPANVSRDLRVRTILAVGIIE